MKLPSTKQALALLKKYDVPDNIVEHSKQVARVAVLVGQGLNSIGEKIDIDLLRSAALLHDIDKIQTLKTHNHGEIAKDILAKLSGQ